MSESLIIHSTNSFKHLIHSETKQVLMNESLNHWLTIHTNSWFIQKQSKSLWMSHWIIDSWFIQTADSFKSLWMSHWIIDSWFIQTADSFRNKAKQVLMNESLNHWLMIHINSWFVQKQSTYEWVTESLTHDSYKQLIHSETKQVLMNESLNRWLMIHTNSWLIQVLMNESLNHWLMIHTNSWFIQVLMNESLNHWLMIHTNSWFIQKQSKASPYEWVTESLTHDSYKQLIRSETKQVLMNDSLNHWLVIHTNTWFIQKQSKSLWMSHWIIDSWFIQTADSFRNKASPYEWVTESLTRDSHKQLILSETKQVLMNDSLNHWLVIHTNSWFIQKQSKSLWMSHWIIDSWFIQTADSFRNKASPYEWITESLTHDSYKQLIHSETKQVLMNESLNHWLVIHTISWFIQKQSKSLWMSHWIIDSWFTQTADSFRNQASDWIIDSRHSFKPMDSFSNETLLCVAQRFSTVRKCIKSKSILTKSTALVF